MKVSRLIPLAGLLFAHLATLSIARADDEHEARVKTFQNAINYSQDNQGCMSIPYSDLQDQCERKQATVNRWCKDSGRWNCDEVDPKKMQAEIETLKRESDSLKERREDLERKKSSASSDKDKEEDERLIKDDRR